MGDETNSINTDAGASAPEITAGCPNYSLGYLVTADFKAWAKVWQKGMPNDGPVNLRDLKMLLTHCGLRAGLLYRLSHSLWRKRVPFLPGMLSRMNITLFGFDIPPSVVIGPGLYVPHPVGIVINAERIGANVTLIGSITIGMGRTVDFPTIEDDVFVGVGARILGAVTVGKGAKIGANAVVLQDIPAGATAVGVPAKVVRKAEMSVVTE